MGRTLFTSELCPGGTLFTGELCPARQYSQVNTVWGTRTGWDKIHYDTGSKVISVYSTGLISQTVFNCLVKWLGVV